MTGADDTAFPLVLLGIGMSGLAGTLVVGGMLARGLYRTLIAIPVMMAMIAVALVLWGDQLGPTAVLLAVWGLFATAAPVGWWSWVARTFNDEAEAGGGLMVAVVQCAIALGSTLGGLLFDTHGYASTFLASAALLVCAALLTAMTAMTAMTAAPAGGAARA